MRRCLTPLVALFAFALPLAAHADDTVITLDGTAPTGSPDHFFLPFTVPAGVVEIEVDHTASQANDTLDWGLNDPNGFRGWGGGNKEPALVNEKAASRSYLTGPITPGTWNVVVGKANVPDTPENYHVEVHLRTTTTLAPQTERAPYKAVAPISNKARWYAGDFHVHSRESGDAVPTLDAIYDLAHSRGLDFVEISDHNTVSQLDYLNDAQSRHADLLFLPGIEYTTYYGHANAIGATQWVDHKIGQPGVTIDAAAANVAAQGALFSVNHPAYDVGSLCIGCSWKLDLPPGSIDAVEVATGPMAILGPLFGSKAIAFWESITSTGRHAAAIGGSDDHRAGQETNPFQSPIASPTTMVYASELSVAGILDGIKHGRTVVKLFAPSDPMVELTSSVAADGDTVSASSTPTLKATITGGKGYLVRFVHNGTPMTTTKVDADPFVATQTAKPPSSGQDRWRVEVLAAADQSLHTVTSNLWLASAPGGAAGGASGDGAGGAADGSTGGASGAAAGNGTGGAGGAAGASSPANAAANDSSSGGCSVAHRPAAAWLGALGAAFALVAFARRRR